MTQTEEFGRSVTAELGGAYSGLEGKVTGTLSQTFGTDVTVSVAEEETETWGVTIAAQKTVILEMWNLIEQYTFANPDGTPYADLNYIFELTDLTRTATIATAKIATEFEN